MHGIARNVVHIIYRKENQRKIIKSVIMDITL